MFLSTDSLVVAILTKHLSFRRDSSSVSSVFGWRIDSIYLASELGGLAICFGITFVFFLDTADFDSVFLFSIFAF